MDSINPNNSILKSTSFRSSSQDISSSDLGKVDNTVLDLANSLTDLSGLAKRADNSAPSIRMEKLARAQSLINDPNWLNDQNIDHLAGKIIEEELS